MGKTTINQVFCHSLALRSELSHSYTRIKKACAFLTAWLIANTNGLKSYPLFIYSNLSSRSNTMKVQTYRECRWLLFVWFNFFLPFFLLLIFNFFNNSQVINIFIIDVIFIYELNFYFWCFYFSWFQCISIMAHQRKE